MQNPKFQKAVSIVRETPTRVRQLRVPKPRDLRTELRKQSAEEYWRRRQNPRFRRFRPTHYKPRLEAFVDGASRNTRPIPGIVKSAIIPVLMALLVGFIMLGTFVTAEFFLDRHVWANLIPPGESFPSLARFPILAVQVAASLLGFYLASVSIVLGNSYHDVSADTRDLVLGTPRTRIYLASVGMAIGGGLTLVLLLSMEFSFGYLTVGGYVLILISAGWSFIQLAYGAFRLFDPTILSEEPLRRLYRAFNQLESKGSRDDTVALQVASRKANRDLLILAELIRMMSDRVSIDRRRLAIMVGNLLRGVQIYVLEKHVLSPTSTWFIREPVYPKWVEASHSEVSIALSTSTSLRPSLEPSVDWVERRSAELAMAALEACVASNDRDSALMIANNLANAALSLARCYRIEDAITFASIARDRCRNIRETNTTAVAVAAWPPFILASLLLGWREAILGWPSEIQKTVSETKWDDRRTKTVPIRGSQRVWETAQRLLNQVESEKEVEGRRVTPNWYLEVALADACIRSLREVAKDLPQQLENFLTPNPASPLPEANVMSGLQALQALAKAQLVSDTLPEAVRNLDSLMRGNEREQGEEIETFAGKITECRTEVLRRIAGAFVQLQPERTKSEPDLFGEALFSLIHHAEEAIANGDVSLVREVFSKITFGSLVLQEHLQSMYQAPSYQVTTAIFDPAVDILELSGLAMAYATLRGDRSDQPVREVWEELLNSTSQDGLATKLLNILDIVAGYTPMGISPRSTARTEWETRLEKVIVEHGYARPEYHPFQEEPRPWNAPPLIKMLGVWERGGSMFLKPRTIFAAEVIGPLSGEPEDDLRNRRSLRRYYESKDRHSKEESSDCGDATQTVLEPSQDNIL